MLEERIFSLKELAEVEVVVCACETRGFDGSDWTKGEDVVRAGDAESIVRVRFVVAGCFGTPLGGEVPEFDVIISRQLLQGVLRWPQGDDAGRGPVFIEIVDFGFLLFGLLPFPFGLSFFDPSLLLFRFPALELFSCASALCSLFQASTRWSCSSFQAVLRQWMA